jgi:hypothetical protein
VLCVYGMCKGGMKKYYRSVAEDGDFFSHLGLPLHICFVELSERLTNTILPYLLTNKQKNQGFLSKFCHDFDKKVDGVVIEQERY